VIGCGFFSGLGFGNVRVKTGDQAGDMGSLQCAGQDQSKIIGSIGNDKDFAIE
jgi:hypothetical protein